MDRQGNCLMDTGCCVMQWPFFQLRGGNEYETYKRSDDFIGLSDDSRL